MNEHEIYLGNRITDHEVFGNSININYLEEMYNTQLGLQEKLGVLKKIKNNERNKQAYINQIFIAMIEECVEVLRETPYKNPDLVPFGWKKGQRGNKEAYKEELVDLFHFFLNMCIAMDFTPAELYTKYLDKNKENFKRNKEGY